MRKFIFVVATIILSTTQANAKVCDYRPSELLGKGTTAGATAATGSVGVAGAGAKAYGLYSITHATSGAVMAGSTAAGASAAGTKGIIAGSAVWGSAAAVVTNPFVWIPAAIVAVGVGGYEGICWLSDDKETDSKGQ